MVFEWAALIVRFLLEAATVFGLIGGGLLARNVSDKIIFPILGVLIIIAWWFFGAPKADYAFRGTTKLLLEIVVFGIGAFSYFHLFGNKAGMIYLIVAIVDLALIYLMHLQGN